MSVTAPDAKPLFVDRMATVLVIGGAGAFGLRLTENLLATRACRVVIGARTRKDGLVAALTQRYGPDRIAAVTIDRADCGDVIRALAPFCVIDAAGPFQDWAPAVAEQAIAAGRHYIDIADSRQFVAAFKRLDEAARAAGVLAVTGASSTPALSHAVLDALSFGWKAVETVDIAISPGNRAPRGLSVMKAILSYAGKPVSLLLDGMWTTRCGWGELVRRDMPGLGPRWLSLCETPDLDLVPARFPGVQTAIFRAGVELSILHLGLFVLMQAVRLKLLPSLLPLARPLQTMADLLQPFGSDRGGMLVSATGIDGDGEAVAAEWSLVAEGGDGPNIPVLPAVAIVRALLENRLTLRGAMPAAGIIDLPAIEEEFRRFRITTRRSLPRKRAGILPSVLGSGFNAMPPLIRHVHFGLRARNLHGEVDVTGATNIAGRLIARLFGFPREQCNLAASVTLTPGANGEIWTRRFGESTFQSRVQSAGDDHVSERFGPLTMLLQVHVRDGGFDLDCVGWRLGVLPLPRALRPRAKAGARLDTEGRYRFDVPVALPLIGTLIHYRGWLLLRD